MLYIHWPFCKNKCYYCDFVAFEGHEGFEGQYHEALCNEIRLFAQHAVVDKPIQTIFIGGGTPSLYPLTLLPQLFETLQSSFSLSSLKEVTLEVNPGGQTAEHIALWKAVGINRLSIGVQVLDTQVLKKLNRHQSNEDVEKLIDLAAPAFDYLSVDLIIGLPGVTDRIWWNTINKVMQWPIKHLSLYFLSVHEHTPLYYGIKKRKFRVPRDERVLRLYEQTVQILTQEGFFQYEISNFARQGATSLHNQGYWDRLTYRGFGLGAASFDGRYRFSNEKNLGKYIEQFAKKKIYNYAPFCELLTREQEKIEILMLSLRKTTGLMLSILYELVSSRYLDMLMSEVEYLVKADLVWRHEGSIGLTQKGLYIENEVLARLAVIIEGSSKE